MDRPSAELNLAIFCDYENVAIGAQQSRYDRFDINLVLERLLDKGKIVVKKAYSDWSRYESAKRPLHESAFELIEVPHLSYSGKNSADIRLVVDALDLCYTKHHVNAFVIISGDSDFSPLVTKLRENNKLVVGLGVKDSTSQLLVDSCDDFIYYDDLVRQSKKEKKRSKRKPKPKPKPKGDSSEDQEEQPDQIEALEIVLNAVDALFRERDDGSLWGSMVKQTIKRKRPQFSESFFGYRNFNELLEDAQKRKLLELQKDQRSGGYIVLGFGEEA